MVIILILGTPLVVIGAFLKVHNHGSQKSKESVLKMSMVLKKI
jgi:hypothetical protein